MNLEVDITSLIANFEFTFFGYLRFAVLSFTFPLPNAALVNTMSARPYESTMELMPNSCGVSKLIQKH